MNRRVLLAVLLAAFAMLQPLAGRAQAGWTIERFSAEITVQDDGSVRVAETIAVDFGLLEKHGIFRDMPVVYQGEGGERAYTRVTDIAVQQDGRPAEVAVTRNRANLRIQIGDPDATISGRHEYVISYTVLGALRSFAGYDELYWNVTGNEWEAPIAAATARIVAPSEIEQGACYAGGRGSTEPCAAAQRSERTAAFRAENLAPGEGLTAAVAFAPGAVPIITVAAPPSAADVIFSPLAWGAGLLVFGAGLIVLLHRWWHYGRDRYWQRAHLPGERSDRDGMALPERTVPLFHRQPVSVEYAPPDNLRPAQMGVLLDERADTLDVSATIVDLAARGYLLITELPKKWLLGKKDYEFTRTPKAADDLLAYERELLERLFDDGPAAALSSLKNTFYKDLQQVKKLLYQDAAEQKLFAGQPDHVRTLYAGLSGVIGGIGLWAAVALAQSGGTLFGYHLALSGGAVGLLLLGAAGLVLSKFMPRKTGYGRELYERVRGYELFVSGTEKYRAKYLEDNSLFEHVLPYAIMFGVTDKLARAMAEMGMTPPSPAWWHGAAAFNAADFSRSMGDFSQSLSTAMASSPSGSGSGGGGSSGGGFGGGGGGSW